MKTCPHCQFLVADGATTCSVCHRDLSVAPVGAVAGSTFTAAPGTASVGSGSVPPPPPPWGPGQPVPGVAPARTGPSAGKVVAIVAAVSVLGLLALGGLAIAAVTFLGTTDEVVADELYWQEYDDPAGRFTVDLPGVPTTDMIDVPAAFGGTTDLEMLNVTGDGFGASISINPGLVADGMTFADLPFSASGAERGAESMGFLEATLVEHQVVEGTGDTQMDAEMRGTVDGEPAVMLSRVVLAGADVYEVAVAGPEAQRDELVTIWERLSSSFEVLPTS
jgi:hypothetical protein